MSILFLACATTHIAYYKNLNSFISAGKYSEAAALTEKSKYDVYGEKNALLYFLDRAFLLHLSNDYEESNLIFEKAKRLSEELFTKSITTELSTLLVSDNVRPYYGEDFERALINFFCAMNYILLGNEQEALVEARQVDHFLKTLQTNYGYKNLYKEDAFVRYIIGMLYENQGGASNINDAFISYRKALDSYRDYEKFYGVATPKELINDALKTAKKLGLVDEIKYIRDKWLKNIRGDEQKLSDKGEAVILIYNGFAPEKIDTFIELSFGKAWAYVGMVEAADDEKSQIEQANRIARSIAADEQITIAFPKYVSIPYRTQTVKAVVKPLDEIIPGVVVEDIGAIAKKSLEDRINRIRIRAIARAAIKYALTKKISQEVEKRQGEVAGWFTQTLLAVASAATELADKRCWRSLPDKVIMVRVPLPAGKHSIELKFFDENKKIVKNQVVDNIQVKTGKKTFVVLRNAI
ncbi:MAG: hypothetical protein QME68_04210 [Elusimicrobiota bacterium]|nr:hypothetical protein [Elusimicrobiota bacterium]